MLSSQTFSEDYDAVIIGARCAGASIAMLLARAGKRVLVLDKEPYGSDTLSTHILMRAAVIQLDRWGLAAELEEQGTTPVKRTTFHFGADPMSIEIKPIGSAAGLYAPRRTLLDPLLVDAAKEAGAEFRFGWTMADLVRSDEGRVCGVVARNDKGQMSCFSADLVIGADGKNSRVAKLAGGPYHPSCTARLICHALLL